MKKLPIKNSNDLLGLIIQISDEKGYFTFVEIIEYLDDKEKLFLKQFVDELINLNAISLLGTNEGVLCFGAEKLYQGRIKKKWNKIKFPLSNIICYILGIMSTVISEYILYFLIYK